MNAPTFPAHPRLAVAAFLSLLAAGIVLTPGATAALPGSTCLTAGDAQAVDAAAGTLRSHETVWFRHLAQGEGTYVVSTAFLTQTDYLVLTVYTSCQTPVCTQTLDESRTVAFALAAASCSVTGPGPFYVSVHAEPDFYEERTTPYTLTFTGEPVV